MHEGLNHWNYIYAAYALGIGGTAWLIVDSWLSMRKAEARRDRSRGK